MNSGPIYPSRDLLRRGPPRPGTDLARQEKWCRVFQVVGVQGPQGGLQFDVKGPFVIPMGVRRRGTTLGEAAKAWMFFTHPYQVFDRDGGFFNGDIGGGILGATIVERARDGILLYDEVGVSSTERVASHMHGALGGMRERLLTDPGTRDRYLSGFVSVDLMLLRTFRILTLLLRSRNPKLLFQELDSLLRNRTVFAFFGDEFTRDELQLIKQGANSNRPDDVDARAFGISHDDFMTSERLRDANGRQVVGVLKNRFERFQNENRAEVIRIENRQQEIGPQITEIKRKIAVEEDRRTNLSGVGRFISGRLYSLEPLKEELVALERESDDLERAYHALPGYKTIKTYTRRLEDYNGITESIERLAANIFDYNVGLNQIKEMEELAGLIRSVRGDERDKNIARYSMYLRANIAPRIMQVFSISAYVLRRPDSVVGETSVKSVWRVNRMAEKLIEYFRYLPYEGNKTLGDAFDEGWGQVRMLEARL